MILIGITGKAGAGKDTVGDILRIDYGFQTVSFAEPIKHAVSAMLGEDPALWEDRAWKERVHPVAMCTPRYMAQTLGTEWGRTHIKEDLWVDLAFNKGVDSDLAITDVRFPNEARRVRERGVLLHVHRVVEEKIDNTSHASEAGIEPYFNDLHINNDSTLTKLRVEVGEVLNEIQRRVERLSA